MAPDDVDPDGVDPNDWMGPEKAGPDDIAGPEGEGPDFERLGLERELWFQGNVARESIRRWLSAAGIDLRLGETGCAVILILGVLVVLGMAYAAIQWLTSDRGEHSFGTSPPNEVVEEPLVPIAGTWEVENQEFVEGCGPHKLGTGIESGTIEVVSGGAGIRVTPSDPESGSPLALVRTETSSEHASYTTQGGFVVVQMRFPTPDTTEVLVYYQDPGGKLELCVVRPAEGRLLRAAPTGSDEDGEPSSSSTTAGPAQGEDDPSDDGNPPSDGSPQLPADLSMPPPGETRLELGGENFTFSAGLECTITEDTILISGTTTVSGDNQVAISINGSRVGDRWAVGIDATSASSGISMSSFGDAVDIPIIVGETVYIEATFTRILNEDIENAEDMGQGTIAANCS